MTDYPVLSLFDTSKKGMIYQSWAINFLIFQRRPIGLSNDCIILLDVSCFWSVSHKIHSKYLFHRQPCQLVVLKMNGLGKSGSLDTD